MICRPLIALLIIMTVFYFSLRGTAPEKNISVPQNGIHIDYEPPQ